MTVRGMRSINLNTEVIKILGIHFRYNKKLKEEKTICDVITNAQYVLKLWKSRKLILEEKAFILKIIAFSKTICFNYNS